MDAKLEALLREIYALEPSLAARDHEVRTLVRELLEVRPRITPDRTFVARLRAEVLGEVSVTPRVVSTRGVRYDFAWWSYRLAPIGVFAALTLAFVGTDSAIYRDLVGNDIEVPTVEQITERAENGGSGDVTGAPVESTMHGMGGGVAPYDATIAPSGSSAKTLGAPVADVGAAEISMMADDEASLQANVGERIEIGSQPSGSVVVVDMLAISVPSHIRLFSYVDGAPRAVLATTEVIPAGVQYDEVAFTTDRPMRDGEVVYAQVFVSDGIDGFEPYKDLPLYNEQGGFVSTIFVVTDSLY